MAEASENRVVDPDERGILVTDIPFVTDDHEQLKVNLRQHFESPSNGGGDIDIIVCPVGGNMSTAIVVFMSSKHALSAVKHRKHQFADEDLEVSLLPPVFRDLTVTIQQFYLDILTRKEDKNISQNIADLLGKANIKESKAHRITKATCTMLQLREIQLMLLANGPLGNQPIQEDISERSTYITNIPYLTDDKEQLQKELETYFQRVILHKPERLFCGIQGDLAKAIAVFRTTEDMVSFLELTKGKGIDAQVPDEELSVSELPPLFTDITAECDEFYFKMIPKKTKEKLLSAMEERGGPGSDILKNSFSGSLPKVNVWKTLIMEAIGIAPGQTKQHDEPTGSTSELKQEFPKLEEPEKARSTYAATNHAESSKSDVLDHIGSDSTSNTSKLMPAYSKTQDKASPKQAEEPLDPDEKRGIKTHPGKAQRDPKPPPRSNKDKQKMGNQPEKRHSLTQQESSEVSNESNNGKHEDRRKPAESHTHKTSKRKNPQHRDDVPKHAKLEENENRDGDLDIKPPADDNATDSIDVDHKHITMTKDLIDANKEQSQSASNHHDDTRKELSGGFATTSSFQDDSDGFAEVDAVIFQYVTINRKEEYEAIETKHDVSITARPNQSGVLVVEVKSRKKSKRSGDATLEAKEEFIKLYSKTVANVICRSLDCSRVSPQKLKKATKMISTKFKGILLLKESDKMYTFCADEATVKDGMDEFRTSASMDDEDNQPLSVDKITFQYLKSKTQELDNLAKKYKVCFDLKDSTSNTPEQQDVYIKPVQSGKQKKKVTTDDIKQAKEDFISLYQSTFYAIKRVSLTCSGVSKEILKKAVRDTTTNFPDVLIVPRENDFILCGKENEIDKAVNNFRRIAGLLPAGRKLKKSSSREDTATDDGKDPTRQFGPSSHTDGKGAMADSSSSFRKENEGLPSVFATKEGIEIIVLQGDITKQEVNIIVNASNCQLQHHRGGVAKAISKAAGPELQKECDQLMRRRSELQIGDCVTSSGYKLRCDYVIHTVGPNFDKQIEKNALTFVGNLRKTFLNVLLHADAMTGVKTIAIPLISSGNCGGPKEACTEALALALADFCEFTNGKLLQQVFLVNIDSESTNALRQSLSKKFPSTSEQETTPANSIPDQNQYPLITRSLTTREGLQVIITTGDITTLKVDAIVNAANGHLRHGKGVAGAIVSAAGYQLTEESKQIMAQRKQQPLQVGEIVETGAYQLPCKTVIHAVGPRYEECPSDDVFYSMLKQNFQAVLSHANSRVEAEAVALPLISSGIFGGPKELCSKALVEAVTEFSENTSPLVIKSLHLINNDHEATKAIDEAFHTYRHTAPENQTTKKASAKDEGRFATPEGIQICVQRGDITKLAVDAIINPTDYKLTLAGGVSQAILKAAGDKFKDECRDKMKHRRHLQPDDVVHTSGGNLPSKYVLHVVSPYFNSTCPKSDYSNALKDTFKACLRAANHSLKLTSVALPLLGSGKSGAPSDLSILALVKAIEEVSSGKTRLVLREITVVCIDEQTEQDVRHAFEKSFKHASENVAIGNTISPSPRPSNQDGKTMERQQGSTVNPNVIYQAEQGINVIVGNKDFTKLTVDVLIIGMGIDMKHQELIHDILENAGGPKLMEEIKGTIKRRKHLKPGEHFSTDGHGLSCKKVVHYVEKMEESSDSGQHLLSILFHARTTLRAKSMAFLVDSSSRSFAKTLAKAIKSFTKLNPVTESLAAIQVVTCNDDALFAINSVFPQHLKYLRSETGFVSPSLDGSTLASTDRADQRHKQQSVPPDTTVNITDDKSHSDTPKGSSSRLQGLRCQTCYKFEDVRALETCGHKFCPECIQRYVAPTSTCPQPCNVFYCIAEEKTLHGTMTAYHRTDIHLSGSPIAGAIFITYEFPAGIQGPKQPNPGRQYKGTTASAYLPCDQGGFSAVRQLREAFIAGLTFTVKRTKTGDCKVAWSDKIPHKLNTKGGKMNGGYPDYDYMHQLKAALRKALLSSSRQSADDKKS